MLDSPNIFVAMRDNGPGSKLWERDLPFPTKETVSQLSIKISQNPHLNGPQFPYYHSNTHSRPWEQEVVLK